MWPLGKSCFPVTIGGYENEGHIHVDEPYARCFWPCPVDSPLTITVPLMLPGEGGINFYPGATPETLAAYYQGEPVYLCEPEYNPYELGSIYWHTGHTPHQIAYPCEIGKDQYRITLQAHGVRLTATNQYVLYF